ncbi:MAG: hypothetical protein ABTQ26_08945 [Azonexus sp.]
MSADLSDMAVDIAIRVRSARAVVRQIDEVMPLPTDSQYDQHCEAGYLLAAVVDLLDMVSNSAEVLEVALKAKRPAHAH